MTIIHVKVKVKNENSFIQGPKKMNADEKDMTVELALYKSLYEANYLGCYGSLIDFAKELLFDNNDIPE